MVNSSIHVSSLYFICSWSNCGCSLWNPHDSPFFSEVQINLHKSPWTHHKYPYIPIYIIIIYIGIYGDLWWVHGDLWRLIYNHPKMSISGTLVLELWRTISQAIENQEGGPSPEIWRPEKKRLRYLKFLSLPEIDNPHPQYFLDTLR
jgi:hypothetical protein